MSIFTLTAFLTSGQTVALRFKSEDAATKASGQLIGKSPVHDDFGSIFQEIADMNQIAAIGITDEAQANNATVELALIQARGQVRAQQRAAEDPTINIQAAGQKSGTAGIITPNQMPFPRPRGN